MKTMGMTTRSTRAAMTAAALAVSVGLATPARADTPEEKFINDIKNANSVATNIPGTPEKWVAAGWASCDRISRTSSQGVPIRAAINNEVIAAKTFNVIPQQDAVALVTYAVLDLCPNLIPNRGAPGDALPDGAGDPPPDGAGDPPPAG
jgi:hypothetical protein